MLRASVVLRMRRREVAAVIVVVVLLLAVIGQRAAARLPPADAAAVGEGREEQRIDGADLRERVEHLVGAFVEERDRADLDADGLRRHLRREWLRPSKGGETRRCRRRAAQKLSPIHRRALRKRGRPEPPRHNQLSISRTPPSCVAKYGLAFGGTGPVECLSIAKHPVTWNRATPRRVDQCLSTLRCRVFEVDVGRRRGMASDWLG